MLTIRIDTLKWPETGIYVRAQNPITEKFETCDIAQLTKGSLLEWLRSRGGANLWAENVVGILLGLGHLHDTTKPETPRDGWGMIDEQKIKCDSCGDYNNRGTGHVEGDTGKGDTIKIPKYEDWRDQ